MKQIIAIFILTFMLCGMLASCGNKSSDGQGGANNGGTSSGNTGDESGDNENSGENQSPETNGDSGVNENTENNNPNENENPENNNPNENENTENNNPNENENPEENENQGDSQEQKPQYTVGYQVGNLAPTMDVEAAKGGTVNIDDYRGKVVVINFWGKWCYYCRVELPDFSTVASEYDDVVVIAIHSDYGRADAPSYISNNFPSSEIIFAYDNAVEEYYTMLGGTGGYPRTLVLDKDGVVTYARNGALSYETLATLVENAGAPK